MGELRNLVKTYYDYQLMRVRIGNRMRKKKDGTDQNENPKTNYDNVSDNKEMETVFNDTSDYEKVLEKIIKDCVEVHPLWSHYLKDIKGVGHMMAAVLISEIDIHKADTVSKMLAFTGISPGMVKGKKWNKNKTKIIETDTMIRQDKKTAGFLCPYNQWLRSKIMGVLASGFIKSKSPFSEIFYNNYVPEKYRKDKTAMEKRPELAGRYGRLDLSEQMTVERKKGGKIEAKMWKDCAPKHRQMAAMRKMIKEFYKELYIAWRTIEGLPVREPYEVEYLGKNKHTA